MQPHSTRAKETYRRMATQYNHMRGLGPTAAIKVAENVLLDSFIALEEELLETQRQTAILLEQVLGRKG